MNNLKQYQTIGKWLEKYGGLLTFHQREVMERHYFYDLTQQEIADDLQISKSAVHEIIAICGEKLAEYEKVLHINELEGRLLELLERLESADAKTRAELLREIKELIHHGL